jgi:hypothetical protein
VDIIQLGIFSKPMGRATAKEDATISQLIKSGKAYNHFKAHTVNRIGGRTYH